MADYSDIKKKYQELSEQLNDPSVTSDPQKLKEVSQEYSELKETVSKIEDLEQKENEMKDAKEMLQDPEMKEEAEREISNLKPQISNLKSELEFDLLPQDPRDKNDVIMEIRAGAGGDEAGLFAADLYRMYTRFAEEKGWSSNLISSNRTGIGGFKEIIFEIKGQNAYKMLKYESGVHRVQRVPETEKSGRIHTSTVTVAVMPLIQKEEINIKPGDLKIDVYRASGAGGQHVNKTESAVRVTHIPTGAVASCQSERSQQRNREKAMAVLAARIADAEEEKRMKEEGDMRRSQVGTGDRSEKIRTYNYPQDRVTDHRIKLTTKNLNEIIDGKLEKFTEALIKADNEAKQNR